MKLLVKKNTQCYGNENRIGICEEKVNEKANEAKSKNAISIIGGADGPTSIFIAGHSKKPTIKD